MRLRAWIVALLALTGGAGLCWAASEPLFEQWKWVRVEPNGDTRRSPDPWVVLQGDTKVNFLGDGRFRIELRHRSGIYQNDYVIEGRITGSQVVAREIKQNADADPLDYRGTITETDRGDGTKQRWISLTSLGVHLGLRTFR